MYSILSYLWSIKNIHLQNKYLLTIKYIYWQQIYLLAINLFIGNKHIFFKIRIYFRIKDGCSIICILIGNKIYKVKMKYF